MPWSASILYAPARPALREAWLHHPALSLGVHHFPELQDCPLPDGGLLAVAEILPPHQCEYPGQIPWDAIFPRKPFRGEELEGGPPSAMLAALSEMAQEFECPLLFYQGQSHGGEFEEVAWLFQGKSIQRKTRDPLAAGLRLLGAHPSEGGWFAPHTSTFDWTAFQVVAPLGKPPESLYQAAQRADWTSMNGLLEHGHRPTGYAWPTPLAWAARHDNLAAVESLLARGARPSDLDLSWARSPAVVERLLREQPPLDGVWPGLQILKNGCLAAWRCLEPNLRPVERQELFLAACEGGVVEIVQECLECDSQLTEVVAYGDTPLSLAASGAHLEVADLLVSYGARWEEAALAKACAVGCIPIVERALLSGLAPNTRRYGRTPMGEASRNNQVAVLDILLRGGACADEPDQYGATPLHASALVGAAEAVEWLLQQGVAINPVDDSGYHPLWCAVGGGHQVLVDRLLAAGADPNHCNRWGTSVRVLAEQRDIQLP